MIKGDSLIQVVVVILMDSFTFLLILCLSFRITLASFQAMLYMSSVPDMDGNRIVVTKVPIMVAVDIISDLLRGDSKLGERTDLTPDIITDLLIKCLTTTYFQYQDSFYQQTKGAAMGSPLSPGIANIFMEHFEDLAIRTATNQPSFWLRYVDDTVVIWRHGQKGLEDFPNHFNSIRSSIQFTMEVEQARELPFLDVLVKQNNEEFFL